MTFFLSGWGGQELPWTKPFNMSHDEFERCKSNPDEMIASYKRPNAPPADPRPDGFRIEDEEGVVVFRYTSQRSDS